MKNLISFILMLCCIACSKVPSEGLTFINDGNIIKVKIGAATTEQELLTLKDSLQQHKIMLELNTLEFNKSKEIKNIKISVDSDLGRGSTTCCNTNGNDPITPIGFIIDKENADAAKRFCLGSNCFQ